MRNVLVFALVFIMANSAGAWAKSASGIIEMNFDLSHHKKGREVRLWIPYPVSDKNQNITKVKISGDYAEAAVYTDQVFSTPMLFARWDKDADSRTLRFSFHAERKEILQPDFPGKEVALDRQAFALYLAATRLGPIDGKVKELADSITRGKTGVLARARAVYDWTVENTYRNPNTRGCGRGDVYGLLKDPGGKCADISSIFVALARASGVPAREVFGIRMGKKPARDISTWQHCWAEFFLPGHGWVSVDPADVRKMMLVEKLQPGDQKTIEYREYFWGGVDPYRIRLGQGRDLVLNPAQHGDLLNYLMYPFAQIGNETLDWLDPTSFAYTITYNQLTN